MECLVNAQVMRFVLVWVAAALPFSTAWGGELELASPFGDHMVLQREMPVAVWGWGTPGDSIDVAVADRSASTNVDAFGRWRVALSPMSAGGPYVMTVRSGGEVVTIEDVLVGEVWICSGQSNMGMSYGRIPDISKLAEEAQSLPIRCLTVQTDVAFEPQQRCTAIWKAGPCGSAVGMAFSFDLHKALNVPVAVIQTCWGSSSIEGWMPRDMTEQLPHFQAVMDEFDKEDRDRVSQIIERARRNKDAGRWGEDHVYVRTRPNILYNAMLHPLAPYTVRGLVWYQGEANTGNMETMQQYAETLTSWTKRLRQLWAKEDFHLLAVMLPRFGRVRRDGPSADLQAPDAHSWAWFRESQMQLLKLPHTGVANTIDLGAEKNIHPSDKRPIGKRLALLALRDVHGRMIVAEGPRFDDAVFDGGTVRIHFKHADGLKTTDGRPLRAFWISGQDRNWHRAHARIEKDTVLLSSENVPEPEVVRYAFAAFPDVNLINRSGLPAFPFRTDRDKP